MVSLWPDVAAQSLSHDALKVGLAAFSTTPSYLPHSPLPHQAAGCLTGQDQVDPTTQRCRDLLWHNYISVNYFQNQVYDYWLDETDEGVGLSGVQPSACGPGEFCHRLYANAWIQTFTDNLKAANVSGIILTRGLWIGAQRLGNIVLWSSDIFSTFEELTAQVGGGW